MIDKIKMIYNKATIGATLPVAVEQYQTNPDKYTAQCTDIGKINMFRRVNNEIFCDGHYYATNSPKAIQARYNFALSKDTDLDDYINDGMFNEWHEQMHGKNTEYIGQACEIVADYHETSEETFLKDYDCGCETALEIDGFVLVITEEQLQKLALENDFEHIKGYEIDLMQVLYQCDTINKVIVDFEIELQFLPKKVYQIQDGYYHIKINIEEV